MKVSFSTEDKTSGIIRKKVHVMVHFDVDLSSEEKRVIQENDFSDLILAEPSDPAGVGIPIRVHEFLKKNHVQRLVSTKYDAQILISEMQEGLKGLKNGLETAITETTGSFEL